jgi:hypothetical protein
MNKSSCVCAAPRYHLLNDVSEKYGIDDWKMGDKCMGGSSNHRGRKNGREKRDDMQKLFKGLGGLGGLCD